MEKLDALNRAIRENNRRKKTLGYQYGQTDCWTLFTIYDYYVSSKKFFLGKITEYKTPRTYHNKVKALGFKDAFDMLEKNGYERIEFDNTEIGDICVFYSEFGDFTISIFDGEYWVNSSNEPKYEKHLPKYVKKKAAFVGRLKEEYHERV